MATTSAPAPAEPVRRRRGPALWWARFRALPRSLRLLSGTAFVLALVVLAGVVTGVAVVRHSFPQTTGTIELDGLTGEVEIIRDDAGIPQIYADTTDDLMFAQGFVHAQERFFEMDVRRHATAGRLAEMFGTDAVETDMYVRTLGWRLTAEKELPMLEPATRAMLDAYAAGVNAYLNGRSRSSISLEYTVLGFGGSDYTPERWTALDSLTWLKAMAWDLRGNMDDEIARLLSADAVGETRARQLFPRYPYAQHQPIVSQGAVVDDVFEQGAEVGATRNPTRPAPFGQGSTSRAGEDPLALLRGVADGLDRMPSWLGRGDGLGSNSWVVDGNHTESGAPLLANDPHLGVSMPGIWMQVGLHCREVTAACPFDVSGFSFSGMPGVVIGHNAHIAWGFTNMGTDVSDLFLERISGDQWRQGRSMLPLEKRTETITVAGGDDVTFTVRSTKHGPLLSDVDDTLAALSGAVQRTPHDGEQYAVSLAWVGSRPSTTADALFALNLATDWPSFREALTDFAAPAQNVIYADAAGHIGYQATGLTPVRRSGNDGLAPSAGWRPENDWTGQFLPYSSLPNVLDPDDGFIVTANQAVVGPDYPYYLTDDWDRGYRSQRIRDLLADKIDAGPVTTDDMARIQLDTRDPLAPTLVPYLLNVIVPERYESAGQRLLRTWDFTQPTGDGPAGNAAAYYNMVWSRLLALTFHDELPHEAWPTGGARWMGVVANLLARPHDPWWDDVTTDEVESRDDILEEAMRQARDELTRLQDVDPREWSWGRLHELQLRSSTLGESGVGVVERLFNRGGWEASGGGAAVNATGWDATEGFGVATAASMRMVVDLADLDASRWVNLGGVSGHAFHPHYTDQVDLWAQGRTLPWAFTRDAVEAAGEDVLTLVPAP